MVMKCDKDDQPGNLIVLLSLQMYLSIQLSVHYFTPFCFIFFTFFFPCLFSSFHFFFKGGRKRLPFQFSLGRPEAHSPMCLRIIPTIKNISSRPNSRT